MGGCWAVLDTRGSAARIEDKSFTNSDVQNVMFHSHAEVQHSAFSA